jgi:hypothetical protein
MRVRVWASKVVAAEFVRSHGVRVADPLRVAGSSGWTCGLWRRCAGASDRGEMAGVEDSSRGAPEPTYSCITSCNREPSPGRVPTLTNCTAHPTFLLRFCNEEYRTSLLFLDISLFYWAALQHPLPSLMGIVIKTCSLKLSITSCCIYIYISRGLACVTFFLW